ncbi:carboxylating nicotinate-nucleotide diphosphorylase [Magnetovibrio sp.]|uniref:carboxylating nicotinate-nucleotide diphosphorylase n=1 Tax=Magnetovibrio sp. TaxID=2024836 RepID=UPI002F923F53
MNPTCPEGVSAAVVERLIRDALAEDLGTGGDITSASTIPADLRFHGVMAARHDMVVAGLGLAGLVFKTVDPRIEWRSDVQDGDTVKAGDVLARVSGPGRALLTAERTALNLLQHLSGIATLGRTYVDAVAGTGATILDTRKTLPGYRELAKYAARMGGVTNHRMRLDDAVLIKDNHIAVAGSITAAIQGAKDAGHSPIEVECDTLEQVHEALSVGVDAILLDNMSNEQLREAVAIIGGQARTEASGGVTLETVRSIAETGVDSISIGRITQSAPAVDIGLDWTTD